MTHEFKAGVNLKDKARELMESAKAYEGDVNAEEVFGFYLGCDPTTITALMTRYLKMEEALKFYANKENYECDDTSRTTGNLCYDILFRL